jgi:DNA polymerase I-like protein with 3'-5' exonuclease and polymerase domains
VQRVMAQAPTPAATLSVPLDVEAKWGTNWAKAH